jgi:hypothetical protein
MRLLKPLKKLTLKKSLLMFNHTTKNSMNSFNKKWIAKTLYENKAKRIKKPFPNNGNKN